MGPLWKQNWYNKNVKTRKWERKLYMWCVQKVHVDFLQFSWETPVIHHTLAACKIWHIQQASWQWRWWSTLPLCVILVFARTPRGKIKTSDNQEPGGSTLMRMSRREETFMKRNLFWGSETFCYDGSMAEFILLTSMVSGCDIEHHLVHKGAVQRALLNQTLTCIAGTTSEETTVYKQSDTTKVYWVKKKMWKPKCTHLEQKIMMEVILSTIYVQE